MAASQLLTLPAIHRLCISAMMRHGASVEQAEAISAMLSAAERDGCHSHGLHRLEAFARGCSRGVQPKAIPKIRETSTPTAVVVDAAGGWQPLAQAMGLEVLQQRVAAYGVGMMSVYNARGMSGAMWYIAEQLADSGLVSFVFANSPAYLAAHGGSHRVFGTNPMAFGWPRATGQPPLVWDQASSGMARGEIELARAAGKTLPEGIGIGPGGAATTEPAEILEGCQLPFGGHKGGNIALMVELLGAALVGTDLAVDHSSDHPFDEIDRGLFVLALNPAALNPPGVVGSAADRSERLFTAMATSTGGSRLPSQRRYENRRRVEQGGLIEIPRATYDTCVTLAGEGAKL